MGIGTSIVLLAVGAVLAFAVNAELSGVSLDAIGIILMIAGAIGLVVALIARSRADREVVHETERRHV